MAANSWTILAPEESGVENMGPLSEDQKDGHTEPVLTQPSAPSDTPPVQTHPPDSPQVTPLESSEDAVAFHSTAKSEDTGASISDHVKNLTSVTPHSGEQGASADDSASQPLADTESFSDSYTHMSPSHVTAPLPEASDEDEEGISPVEVMLRKTLIEESKPADKANEGDGLRRRNISVLTPLYHQDDEEEEEAVEEQFRRPQREGEGDIGFTLNKCIFGALILLGLGTLFFSEGNNAKEVKYSETKKEWLNPDAKGDTPGIIQPSEILDKLANDNQQIAGLQAQFQEQELELKDAQLQMGEGSKEKLHMEELEAENQRMKRELDKLPLLQKEYEQENERVKLESEKLNKELEALPAIQKELEHLRVKVMELTQSSESTQTGMPSAGQDDVPSGQKSKEKKDKAQRKEKDFRADNKERKKEKSTNADEHGGGKGTKDRKEWEKVKDKQGRRIEGKNGQEKRKQEDGQGWKLDSEKREFKEKSGKREWKGDKKWEKEKHGELVDRKGKEGKEWRYKSEQTSWKTEGEWKRNVPASQNNKAWKEKNEKKKDWKEKKEWGDENERKELGDEKYSGRIQEEKTRKGKNDDHDTNSGPKERWERHQSGKEKDKAKSGQRTEGRKGEQKYKNKTLKKEDKMGRKGKHEASHHSYSDRKHSSDHIHSNYWVKQREKIRHYYRSMEGCADITACAHAEGLAPVSQQDFESFISGYLMKLQEHQDQTSRKEELSKLISEFFPNRVFAHDQLPFSEFVEDLEDILEDMADDDNNDDDNDDDELENEMNGFAIEAMERFVLQEKDAIEDKRGGNGRKRVALLEDD